MTCLWAADQSAVILMSAQFQEAEAAFFVFSDK